MKNKRPTLLDVANQVGVTKMTVSRYLRQPENVALATGSKIQHAIDELGFVPSRAPEILANSKSYAIGVLLPSLTNQVFAQVLRGLESQTEAAGYQTMLAHYGYSEEIEEKRIESLLSYNIDGLLLSDRRHTPRVNKILQSAGIPVIEMMDIDVPGQYPVVGFNNHMAAYTMTQAMIQRGYQHVVYLGARMDARTSLKQHGYEQAMVDAGLTHYSVTTEKASSFSLGGQLLDECLRRYPQCDGIFCTNDDLAIGAIFECQKRGLDIPGQIAVAGFHGHDMGQVMCPQLASVITPREAIGRIAARQMLARLAGQTSHESVVDLGYKLHFGQSI
ncbi:gluconate operon transcriptional repressor GntR [Celerinatantimonas diazotrophica]|uniref:LacI family transcriptional regulator n=1 Tax=Celerinatantimonas diazotrophica TaxID=412034 RepID=A0A4R1K4E7_9GAMM|nr:gluconate operon transcriptional repressor GntR [Celerinatantimonas diazotrophica]TCK58984.1 LacI family transcriptional regulator [Celerinatantimonas diazotrophica]CAG9297619.1 HTH-type transcriptional regulator GntR [Celerinatantimonas diazotrophica]